MTIGEVLDRGLASGPERLALVGRSGRFTYAELDRAANRAAHALAALGVSRGERVAACLPNDVDIVVAFLGAMRLGAIWVGVNKPLAPREKAWLLRDSGARVLLAPRDMVESLNPERESLPELAHVVEVDSGAFARTGPETRPPLELERHAPAAIAYTSGTTGFPKGAVHSHHNLLLPGAVAAASGTYGPDVRQGVLLPLTILNLIVLGPLVAFQDLSALVCIDRIDPDGVAEWVRRERVGHFAAVPTVLYDLLTHPSVRREDLASLRRPEVGGAECPEEFRRLYRARFGGEVTIGYGMTEAPTAVTRSDGSAAPRPGLCGKAVPQVEIRILDEKDQPVPDGEVGEICVGPARTGPWAGAYTPMLGYWNQPEETAKALRGGVYHSGDLGFFDERGDLYICGRRNELILRGGANVYPAEVERVLAEHPAVAASAVLGRPDTRLGQRVVAAVQLAPGASARPDELAAFARERLARYKVPEEIALVAALPRNAMGKVVKRELEALFAPRA
ncbi:MAG TPA: AMP-binding protein [Myxococcota bacterium]|nr:AMP-binding protein [Myxococcota bacterium]